MTDDKQPVLVADELEKVYRTQPWKQNVRAVDGLSFSVPAGHIFGLVGPNGAGKTTMMKMMFDFIRPTSGAIELFGESPGNVDVRNRVGYLPENPSFYEHLTVEETVHYAGRLHGMSRSDIRDRTDELLSMVDLEFASDRRVGHLSKGMTQRLGIAQALVNDPDLVVMDEPQSGLDPIGRREVRKLLVSLHERGKTVLFSSHVLYDIEMVCDSVCIINSGQLVYSGSLEQLKADELERREIEVTGLDQNQVAGWDEIDRVRTEKNRLVLEVKGQTRAEDLASRIADSDGKLISVKPKEKSLEELFEKMYE